MNTSRYCQSVGEILRLTEGRDCCIDHIDEPEGHFGATAEVIGSDGDTVCVIAADTKAAVLALARAASVDVV